MECQHHERMEERNLTKQRGKKEEEEEEEENRNKISPDFYKKKIKANVEKNACGSLKLANLKAGNRKMYLNNRFCAALVCWQVY